MSKLFKRVVEVITEGVRMNNTNLDIEFEIPFDDDLDPNISEITIYNLSNTTRNMITRGKLLTINAGYEGDKGLILSGYINSVNTKHENADKPTIIKVSDSKPLDADKTLQKSFKKGIKAEQILRELAKVLGLSIAVLILPKNKAFAKGFAIDGEILKAMQDISKDCGAACYISRSKLFIRSLKIGDDHRFVLNRDTGLVGSPEYFEEEKDNRTIKGYKVNSLLQYRMNTASIIELQSIGVKAKVRVSKGKHICRGDSFYTEVEAIL